MTMVPLLLMAAGTFAASAASTELAAAGVGVLPELPFSLPQADRLSTSAATPASPIRPARRERLANIYEPLSELVPNTLRPAVGGRSPGRSGHPQVGVLHCRVVQQV